MNFDLNGLLILYQVVNAQSITKAARTLGLPKSTVSRKIQHLETQVGSALLRRGNRRIAVTDDGRRLYDHCARIAAEVESAGLQTTQTRTSLKGRLRISMPIDFGIGWLSRAIASFATNYPSIQLDIHVNGRWIDVSEETYDVAMHLGPVLNTELPVRRLSALSRGIYASPQFAARHPNIAQRWHDCDCIPTEQQLHEGIWTDAGGDVLARRNSRIIVNNIGVARQLVISGLGVGALPNVMCRNDLAAGRLVRIETPEALPPLEASATFFAGRYMPNKIRVFLDHIAAYLASDESARADVAERPVARKGKSQTSQAATKKP